MGKQSMNILKICTSNSCCYRPALFFLMIFELLLGVSKLLCWDVHTYYEYTVDTIGVHQFCLETPLLPRPPPPMILNSENSIFSRTVHSLVALLSMFKHIKLVYIAPPGLEMPRYIVDDLSNIDSIEQVGGTVLNAC